MDEEELDGLLNEMIGLGVIVGDLRDGYRLRSPNVLSLLGSSEEVNRELERFRTKPYEKGSKTSYAHRP